MDTPTFYLVPRDGITVRDPTSGIALPVGGAAKPQTAYWLRRLRDGDVAVKPEPKRAAVAGPLAAPKKGDSK